MVTVPSHLATVKRQRRFHSFRHPQAGLAGPGWQCARAARAPPPTRTAPGSPRRRAGRRGGGRDYDRFFSGNFEQMQRGACFTPEERANFRSVTSDATGLTDAFRLLYPATGLGLPLQRSPG